MNSQQPIQDVIDTWPRWSETVGPFSSHLGLELAAFRHRGHLLPDGAPVPGCSCLGCLLPELGKTDLEEAAEAIHTLALVPPKERGRAAQVWVDTSYASLPAPATLTYLASKVPYARREIASRSSLHARTGNAVVEKARQLSLVEVCNRLGIGLRSAGKELVGSVPWREDRHPSLHVNPAKGVWCDRADGNLGGDGIALWMRTRRVDFITSVHEMVGTVR